jgi:hypothetical protein
MLMWLVFSYINVVCSLHCSWNYRFDSYANHFNIVYPDKNAVYFGMIIPENTSNLTITSGVLQQSYKNSFSNYPSADYFSIQVYEMGNFIESIYNINDEELIGLENLVHKHANYSYNLILHPTSTYFALYRIYNSHFTAPQLRKNTTTFQYWSGIPPITYINGEPMPLCDNDYQHQGNIYTNVSQDIINPVTRTVCKTNNEFAFMNIPSGSLANSDANYLIACIQPGSLYTINIRMPRLMCSLGYGDKQQHPLINESYDLRYASVSLVSTNVPRPTIESWRIPCEQENFTITIYVDDDIPQPAFLYRQIIPDAGFKHSILNANERCFDYVENKLDIICVRKTMDSYYPSVIQTKSKDTLLYSFLSNCAFIFTVFIQLIEHLY